MLRMTLLALLAGLALAAGLTLTRPTSAGARLARTTTRGSSTNADGTSGAPVNTIAPTLSPSGHVSVGAKLNCSAGTWANDPVTYRERWRVKLRLVHTGATYTVPRAERGDKLSCYVAAANEQGTASAVLAGSVTVRR